MPFIYSCRYLLWFPVLLSGMIIRHCWNTQLVPGDLEAQGKADELAAVAVGPHSGPRGLRTRSVSFLEYFLSDTWRCSMLIVYFRHPSPGVTISSRRPRMEALLSVRLHRPRELGPDRARSVSPHALALALAVVSATVTAHAPFLG